jgi:hypothetical protein
MLVVAVADWKPLELKVRVELEVVELEITVLLQMAQADPLILVVAVEGLEKVLVRQQLMEALEVRA